MAPVPTTVPELVEQLGRTFSPFERLKILTRAWALLRRMAPEERLVVATQLGLDRADEVVEAIAERTGTAASPTLLSMIERAQTKGTTHLPQLIADLKDPERRAEHLRQGARAAEAALAGGEPAPPWPPPAISAPSPPPPQPAPAPPRAAAQEAPASPSPAPVAAPESPAPRPESPPAPADGGVAGHLAATPSVLARFRRLRDHLGGSKRPPIGDLHALLDLFPDGWARRRALAALLEAGVPEKAADVLPLLDALSSGRDRLWCLGALADSRKLSDADRESLLASIASPAARRRLERRFATS